MLTKFSQWIDETNSRHARARLSCGQFSRTFEGSFSAEFLDSVFFVVLDDIPRPDIAELKQMGLKQFLESDLAGITYKDTYYIKRGKEQELSLHFQALVHTVQWREMGSNEFINRYLTELQVYGHHHAPLEQMAQHLASRYQQNLPALDIQSITKRLLNQDFSLQA